MFRHDYSMHFTKLTAEEASRVNRSALVRGYIVKAYEERQAELQYVPPFVLDSSKMTHETFARDMSDEELEATKRVYATLESKGWSYQPEASQAEKFAESLVSFFVAVLNNPPTMGLYDYPIRKLAESEAHALGSVMDAPDEQKTHAELTPVAVRKRRFWLF